MYVTKWRDVCNIETYDLGKTVLNQKQGIAHSSKEHEKWAYDVSSEANTIQGETNRLLDQAKMIQK